VLNGNTRLTAGFNDKLISFEFLSLDFLKQPQIRYMYRLEGFDKDWQNLNNRNRTATYTNLAPGDYRFFVRSSEDGINWTICKKPVLVTVQNIFYRTWWFNLLVILSVCSLLYLVYKYRINQLIKVEQMRSAISSDLHDEIGATLSSISIFSQMAKSLAKTNPRQSAEVLDRIGSRSREMVEGMSDIVWSINPANDDIEKTLLRMRTYAFEMSEATNARLSWEIPEAFNKLKLGMEQRKNFYLIFKEAFNNVIKYAEAKNISIRVHLLKSRIDFLIADDGRGFDPETVKKGNGLSNMHKRAEQLNGNLQILSSPEKGTSIHLQFPL
jgi:two-component sensor histidine kinase